MQRARALVIEVATARAGIANDEHRALELAREAKKRFETKPPPNPDDREKLEKLLARLSGRGSR